MLINNTTRRNTMHISPDQQDVRCQFQFDRNTQKNKGLVSIRPVKNNQRPHTKELLTQNHS